MDKPLDIGDEIAMLKNGPNGEVSEPHHLKAFDACSEFSQQRSAKRFVEANFDMIIHHFIRETTDVCGLNALSEAQYERQDQIAELITQYLLTTRREILKDK